MKLTPLETKNNQKSPVIQKDPHGKSLNKFIKGIEIAKVKF